MTSCESMEPIFAAYLAGEATPRERVRAEAHLLDCAECREMFAQAKAGWDAAADWAVDGVAPVIALPARPSRAVRVLRLITAVAAGVMIASLFMRAAPPPVPTPANSTSPRAAAYVPPGGNAAVGVLACVDPDTKKPVGELAIASMRIEIEIRDGVAQTTVEQVFTNHTDRRLEGTFVFPLPPDAAITRLAMEIEGKLIEGECVEREKARETYEGIVRRMKDPALLEWMPGGLFRCRIFPIEAKSDKRIILSWQQVLPSLDGRMQYVYPLVSETTAERAIGRFEVAARVAGAKMTSPSHAFDATGTFTATAHRAAADVVLDLEAECTEFVAVAHTGHVACLIAPRPDAVERARVPAGTVFVVDCSASVSAAELEVAKKLVERMIDALGGGTAQVIGHSVLLQMGDRTNDRAAAKAFLARLTTGGGSDVGLALAHAMCAAPEGGEVVYVGEGAPTVGETDVAKLIARARENAEGRDVTFRAVAIGSGADQGTLGALATAFHGGVHAIAVTDDVERRVAEIVRTLGRPAMTDVRLAIEGTADAAPASIGSLYFGERSIVAARVVKPGRSKAVLTARVHGREIRREWAVELPAEEPKNLWVKRLWAQRRVADLTPKGEAARAEIVSIGVGYQLMTPFTSFLVLENERAYEEHRIERTKKEKETLVKGEAKDDFNDEIRSLLADGVERYRRGDFAAAAEQLEKAFQKKPSSDLVYAFIKRVGDDVVAGMMGHADVRMSSAGYRLFELAKPGERIRKAKKDVLRYIEDLGAADAAVARNAHWHLKNFGFERPELLVEASAAIKAGDRAKAERMVRQILEDNMPDSARVYVSEVFEGYVPPDEAARRALEEAMKSHSVQDQARLSESDQLRRRALAFKDAGELHKAKQEAMRAVERWPGNAGARKLLAELNAVMVGGRGEQNPRSVGQDQLDEFKVNIERSQMEITNHIRQGERFYAVREYDSALREFEQAEFKIKSIPYDVIAMKELLPKISDYVGKARDARTLERTRVDAQKRREGSAEVQAHELARRREVHDRVADEHYRLAERWYQAGDYDRAEVESQKAIQLNPRHAPADALLIELHFMQGKGQATPASEVYQKLINEAVLRHQQVLLEIDAKLARATRSMNAGRSADAARDARIVLEYAKWLPTGVEMDARRRQAMAMLDPDGPASPLTATSTGVSWAGGRSVARTFGTTHIDEFGDAVPGFPGSEVGPGFITTDSARNELYDLRAQAFHNLLRAERSKDYLDDHDIQIATAAVVPDPVLDSADVLRIANLQREFDAKNATMAKLSADADVVVRQMELQITQIQEMSNKIEEYRSKLARGAAERSTALQELQYARQEAEVLQKSMGALEEQMVALTRDRKRLEETIVALSDASLAHATRAYNGGYYEEAERELALLKQGGVFGARERDLRERTRAARRQKEVDEDKVRLQMLEEEKSRDELRKRVEQKRELEILFGQAQLFLEQQRYERAAEICDRMLYVNPNLSTVSDMRDVARRLTHAKPEPPHLRDYVRELNDVFHSVELPSHIDADTLSFPAREMWIQAVAKRRPKGVEDFEQADLDSPDRESLEKLKSIRITMDFANAPLPAVLDYLRELSGLNFVIDSRAIPEPASERISFKATDIVLHECLKLLLNRRGYVHVVENGAVTITSKRALSHVLRVEVYDVEELLSDLPALPGVDMSRGTLDLPDGRDALRRLPAPSPRDPELIAIERKLRTIRMDVDRSDANLHQGLRWLGDYAGLDILIDARVSARPGLSQPVRVVAKDAALVDVLTNLLSPLGLHFQVTDEKVVLVTLRLEPVKSGDFAALVRRLTDEDAWSESDGRSIEITNGLLAVRNTADMHKRVCALLYYLRRLRDLERARLHQKSYDTLRKLKELIK